MRPEIDPPALVYIWRWFMILSPCREIGMTAGAISHREIKAWSELTATHVTPAEVDALRRVDQAFLSYQYAKNNPDKNISISDKLGAAAALAKGK